jgi:endogenous inhibitor of DNA gyrase (YacG/DUF329 family)
MNGRRNRISRGGLSEHMPKWLPRSCPRCGGAVAFGSDIDQGGKHYGLYLNCVNCGWDKLWKEPVRPVTSAYVIARIREEMASGA